MITLIIIYFIIINIIGFSLMYIDKKRAINNNWRIKESTLIYTSLLGGSIGSFLGMNTFRHKTKHTKFTLGIPAIIFMQLLLFYYILK